MHAVVVRVKLSGSGPADPTALREQVVPRVKQLPGFVAGYWTRLDDEGLSMVVFESEENAKAASGMVPSMIPDDVSIQSNDVREVVANG
jgi:hypothetical protein